MGNVCCSERENKKKNIGDMDSKKDPKVWKTLSKAKLKDLNKLYKINLTYKSKGSIGKFYEATSRKNPDYKIAIKIVEKRDMDEEELMNLAREVEILRKVDHMNIVRYIETYDERDFIYLCMELINGSDLLQKVIDSDRAMTEIEASKYML
jgi:serine/threonine protein kinase